jgi:hypothetical protein
VTEITITYDREDFRNSLRHFAFAINSIGGLNLTSDQFNDYLDSLSKDFVEALIRDSTTTDDVDSADSSEFSEVQGYSIFHIGNENLPTSRVWEYPAQVSKEISERTETNLLRVAQISIMKED